MRSTVLVVFLLVLTGCSGAPQADGAAAMQPYATTKEIIDAIVAPDSQAIFDAVAYENSHLTKAPRTDDQWTRLRLQALAIAEAGNLLMMKGRAPDAGDWMTLAHNMSLKAAGVASAAADRDPDKVLLTGSDLYETCTACHMKYGPKDE